MAHREHGIFPAHDGLQLHWELRAPEAPRAYVGLVHGYMDHAGRFAQVADFLVGQGFAAAAFDFRGHGKSEGRRGHCDRFDDFLEDLDRFWAWLRKRSGGLKTFLLAHSHGALVASLWGARNPLGLEAWVLSAPFLEFGFKPPPAKVVVSRLVGAAVPWLPVPHELNPADLTADLQAQRRVAGDPLYLRNATPRWFTECVKAQARARQSAGAISIPTLMLSGGKDSIAQPQAMRAFFDGLATPQKKFVEYAEMVHEVLNEVGKERVWMEVASWLTSRL
ncbi:MAG TPA: alpha/beta hydrolase [Myxococcaceae bacterium]|nr:alpha/beta hydrolase [Myxococcaceae bacterium]